MPTQFNDTNLTTVDYQITFTKRDYEAILESDTIAVAKNLANNGFASWKVAEFIRRMDKDGLTKPTELDTNKFETITVMGADGKRRLSDDDFEYLQVDYQVLSTVDRRAAKFEEEKRDALREIAKSLEEIKNAP